MRINALAVLFDEKRASDKGYLVCARKPIQTASSITAASARRTQYRNYPAARAAFIR